GLALAVAVLAFFTVASSKVETYLLPASPAIAALLAERIAAGLAAPSARKRLAAVAGAASAVFALAPLGWLAFGHLGASAANPRVALMALEAPRCAAVALLAAPLAVAAIASALRGRASGAVALALAASSVALVAAVPLMGALARWK